MCVCGREKERERERHGERERVGVLCTLDVGSCFKQPACKPRYSAPTL